MSHSIFLKDLIKKYNADPNSFTSDSMFVKSYQVGQSTYFKKVTNSSFWAIRENEALFWLVPKAKLSITEFNRDAIEEVFVCRNHDSRNDGKKFTLIRPVKLELVPKTSDLAFQEKGILDFGTVSETRLTDIEYWVSETEDILVQSLAERITDQFNESMKKEIEAIKLKLARIDDEQHKRKDSGKLNEEVNKLENKFNEYNLYNQSRNRDVIDLQNQLDKLTLSNQKQDEDFSALKKSLDELTQSDTSQNSQIKDIIKNLTVLVSELYPESNTYQEKFALLDKFTQFVDRFTPILVHVEAILQKEQKRTQSQTWESSTDTKPVRSKMETNVAVNAPKKVRHSDMPREIVQMVEIFNTNALDFTYRYQNISVSVAEELKSSIERLKGDEQQIYFEAHNAGSFMAVMDDPRNLNCEVYWLVPKPNTKPNEFKCELWEKLFGYEGQSFTRYKLVAPAKISLLDDRRRYILDCVGEITFI